MAEKLKKDWQKPELIVLVRSKPEEAVLLACKQGGHFGPGANSCLAKGTPCSIFAKS